MKECVGHLFDSSVQMAYGKVTQVSGREKQVAVIKGRDECTAELEWSTKDNLSEIPRNPVCNNYSCTEDLIEITSEPMLRGSINWLCQT